MVNQTAQQNGLTEDNVYQIDFNFHQVASALSVEIPDSAAATMLKITTEQFVGYVNSAYAECKRVAAELLKNPTAVTAINKLSTPRTGTQSTVLAIGDSITTYRYGYAEILRGLFDVSGVASHVQYVNHGRSGYTSTHGLEHVCTQYIAQNPDWVVLKYGVNDTKRFGGATGKLLVSAQEYASNMEQIVRAFHARGVKIVLMTPTPVLESIVNSNPDFQAWAMTWDNRDIQACGTALKAIGKEFNIPVVDLMSIFTPTPNPDLILPDGLHPSPDGHRLIIQALLECIALQ